MHAFEFLALITLSLYVGTGCDAEVAAERAAGGVRGRSGSGGYGGVWLNTSAIGSQPFSEIDLSGALHDGVQVTGVQVKGPNDTWITADKIEVVDGILRIKAAKTSYSGAALIGSRWQIDLVDEQGLAVPREIWIAEVDVISSKEARYSFQTEEDGQLMFLCAPDSLGSHSAAVIKDVTIDPFTAEMAPRKATAYFACSSGAVGKAVAWGYRPWERSLAEFAAAVRVVRADYCFDGMSWTESGTALQLKDRWNINTFLAAGAPTEVVWTRTGIACLSQPRAPTYSAAQITCNGQAIPSCPADLTMTSYADTQFWTKLAPP